MAKIPSYPALLKSALSNNDQIAIDHSDATKSMTVTEMNKQWATVIALAAAATGSFTFTQSSTPSATQAGETWLDTDDGKVYVSSGTGTGNWGTFIYQLVLNENNVSVGIKMTPVKDFDVNGEGRFSDGILFGTDTAVENRLDDYEEGTFTATLASGATTTPTATGYYIKTGNKVTVWLSTNFGSITLNGNPLTISGLPFSANSARAFGSIGETARVQIQSNASHYCKIALSTTVVGFHYMLANSGTVSNLLTEASGTYTPGYSFTLTYKTP